MTTPSGSHTPVIRAKAAFFGLACLLLSACPPPAPPPKAGPPLDVTTNVRWKLHSARRQTSYVRLDLPVISSGTRITIGPPQIMLTPADIAARQATVLERAAAQGNPTTAPAQQR